MNSQNVSPLNTIVVPETGYTVKYCSNSYADFMMSQERKAKRRTTIKAKRKGPRTKRRR